MTTKTIFVTGVSSGFGRAIATAALAAGHKVVGTVRNAAAAADFGGIQPGRSFGFVLDVTDVAAIPSVVAEAEALAGPIHVLVNNAGYGEEGAFEETPPEAFRRQFDVNVFGAVSMMQAVLPGMRARRSGRIVNITSLGGLTAALGLSAYNGSKFALEGITEAVDREVAPLGIRVTAVEPGGFRTDWAGRSMVRAPRSISDYDAVFGPVRAARQQRSGQQGGDPAKLAQAILKLIDMPEPPAHLLLGPDAVQAVEAKIESLQSEIDAWREMSMSTNFDRTG